MLRRRKISLKRRKLTRWPNRHGSASTASRRQLQRRRAKYYNHP